jgi:hypothetical protein
MTDQIDEIPESTSSTVALSRRGNQKYAVNPFIQDASNHTKTGVRRISNKGGEQMMIVSQNTGEIIAPAGFWQAQEVDKTAFVKLYVNGVKAFKELTGAGTKVFEVLYIKVQAGIEQDTVYLSFHDLDQNTTPMSGSTFMRGMRELVSKGFLAESMTPGKYFLNMDYMWNGNRLAFVKEYRIKGTSPDQAKREELEAKGQQRMLE